MEVKLDCSHDGESLKPGSGRGTPEDLQSRVMTCESRRCMTCAVGDTFVSNVNGRTYSVKGRNNILDCSSRNIIYLVGYNTSAKLAKHYGVD